MINLYVVLLTIGLINQKNNRYNLIIELNNQTYGTKRRINKSEKE